MGHTIMRREIIPEMTVADTTGLPMWEILVPTAGNDGTPFSVRHHRTWDEHVKILAGGMTLLKPVRGTWVDPTSSTEYTERMIPVRIVCTEEQIVEICKETARMYDQVAVLATLVAERTVLVTNPNATGVGPTAP